MVKLSVVEAQLKKVGCNFKMWGRSEVKELCEILLPGETIAMAINGQYEAGFAMLVATDFRVLLIDKKPKYLTLKDIRFDMITELDFSNRMLNSTILIFTPNRELRFTAWNSARLRKLFTHTQHKVMEIRHHFMMQQFQQQQVSKNTPPGLAMAQQRYGENYDPSYGNPPSHEPPVDEAQHFYQPPARQDAHPVRQESVPVAVINHIEDATSEQRKIAAAMGSAGLKSIVHNGKVIKDYMAVPFTQRWRKRPYGFTNHPVQRTLPAPEQ